MDYSGFDALTFDCYGTLIDWERGILAALPAGLDADEALAAFAQLESELEAGPYLRYREVLARCYDGLAERFALPAPGREAFADSVGDWPAFPDSPAALARLKERFKLGVITNCDDDLFAASNERLQVEFDWVITAEQARGYKPRTENFELAFARLDLPRERVLHVAQSLFHDHVPAKALGMPTVGLHPLQGRPGGAATPPADAEPDLTVPDLASLAALVER
jgi:2-haloacid dehalogenase